MTEPTERSQEERNKDIYRRFVEECYNNHNVDAIDELVAPDKVNHNPFPGEPIGREGSKYNIRQCLDGFPDLHIIIDLLVAEGDLVTGYLSWTGTHTGQFMGIEPTNDPVTVKATSTIRIDENDQIAEHWGVWDMKGFEAQVGGPEDVLSSPMDLRP
jgi:predicted ester cyclase